MQGATAHLLWRYPEGAAIGLQHPGTGVMRHADAGYTEAIEHAREQGLDLPSLGKEEA